MKTMKQRRGEFGDGRQLALRVAGGQFSRFIHSFALLHLIESGPMYEFVVLVIGEVTPPTCKMEDTTKIIIMYYKEGDNVRNPSQKRPLASSSARRTTMCID